MCFHHLHFGLEFHTQYVHVIVSRADTYTCCRISTKLACCSLPQTTSLQFHEMCMAILESTNGISSTVIFFSDVSELAVKWLTQECVT